MSACLLALVLAAAAVPDGGAPPDADVYRAGRVANPVLPVAQPEKRKIDWLVLPLITYNSDSKLGYGAAALVQWTGGVQPYRYQLAVQALFTTGGVQSHWIHFDSPRFLGLPFRLWAAAEYHHELFTPFYGFGNRSSDALEDHPGIGGEHPFVYLRTLPVGRLGVSVPIAEHLNLFGFATYRTMSIDPYGGSLLAQQRPYGIAGGRELEFSGGAYYDSRDNEAVPTTGWFLGISARGVSQALGSDYTWAGATIQVLRFVSLLPRLILAMRLQLDGLTDGAPFYELPNFGGVSEFDGVGGVFSERGVPQDRYVGRFKALGTLELRAELARFPFRGEPLSFGTAAFLDLGRAYEPGTPDGVGPLLGIHPGYGAGLRLWRRAFVLRTDLASSPDRPFSIYLVFGEFF